jgi:membrane associated rhomboid family serine protease
MKCLACAQPLRPLASVLAVRSWICDACNGVAAEIGTLAATVPPERVAALGRVVTEGDEGGIGCPRCAVAMRTGSVRGGYGTIEVDVCRTCRIAWFDRGELNNLRTVVTAEGSPMMSGLTPMERRAWRLEQLRERGRVDDEETTAALLGVILRIPLPEPVLGQTRPAFTVWGIAAVVTSASIWGFVAGVHDAARRFGLIPDELSFRHASGLLTHFFIHADPFHLMGNMLYFVVFGSRVEALVGSWRLVALVILATLAGGLVHAVGAPSPSIPLIGASGGISGVLAAYVCLRPHSKVRWVIFYSVMRIPAYGFFATWITLQVIGLLVQISGASAVSALAHLGGAATGFAVAWAFRERSKRSASARSAQA